MKVYNILHYNIHILILQTSYAVSLHPGITLFFVSGYKKLHKNEALHAHSPLKTFRLSKIIS